MAARSAQVEGRRDAPAADRLPTLTEVVDLGQQSTAAIAFGQQTAGAAEFERGHDAEGTAESEAELSPGVQELSALVMAELQPRIEMLLEARLREALAPALAEIADALIHHSREQLNEVLQSLAEQAVVKVLDQQRSR
jgi:flagellar biosynthesis/type III secretory pathway protein FliH